MNQQSENTAPEPATVPASELPQQQHLEAMVESFQRGTEQARETFQEALLKNHEAVVRGVAGLRDSFRDEMLRVRQTVLTAAQTEAETVGQRAQASANDLLGTTQKKVDQLLEQARAEAQGVVAKAQREANDTTARANSEAETLLGNAKQEAENVQKRAQVEAEDLVVRASAEADVIIARATTVAAEKVLAHRSGNSAIATKGFVTGRDSESHGGDKPPEVVLSSEGAQVEQDDPASPVEAAASGAAKVPLAPPSQASEPASQVLPVVETPPELNPPPSVEATGVAHVSDGPASQVLTPPNLPGLEPITQAPAVSEPAIDSAAAATSVTPEVIADALPPLPSNLVSAEPAIPGLPESNDALAESPVAAPDSSAGSSTISPSPESLPATESPFVAEATPVEPSPAANPSIPPIPAIPPISAETEAPTRMPPVQVAEDPNTTLESPLGATPPSMVEPANPEAAAGEVEKIDAEALLGIVSSKTGYPREMLEEHLNSGTKLDLTPPKVVEILGELSASFPNAPTIEFSNIPQFLDLGRLVGFLANPLAQPSETASVSQAEPESEAENSPFQLASPAVPDAESTPMEGTPFQPVEPVEAVPLSPFALAAQDETVATPDSVPPSVSDPGTPFQAVDTGPVATSPFAKAQAEETSSPFVAVPAAEVVSSTPPSEDASSTESVPEPPIETEEAPAEITVPMERHVLRSQVANACGLGPPQLHAGSTIHIVPDEKRVSEALRDVLVAQGFQAEITETVPSASTAAIVLTGLNPVTTSEQASAVQLEAFKAARAVMQGSTDGGLFVTVQDTGGDFGMSASSEKDAWAGGLPGLARTVVAERPDIGVKALDMEREGRSAEVIARRILRELTEGGPEVEVGLSSDGMRLTQSLESTELSEAGPNLLPEDGTVIVHGAGQGILTTPVLELARRQRQRFVLLGSVVMQEDADDQFSILTDTDEIRQALIELSRHQGENAATPEIIEQQLDSFLQQREVRRLMKDLRAAGSNVCYFAVDSTDPSALEAILTQVRGQWGGISGVLHASSQREEGRIDAKTESQFVQTLKSNVAGAQNLLVLTKQDPLQLIGLLSPSLHEGGSAGHVDYAMANETLNRMACAEAHRRGGNCVVRSLNWAFCDDGTLSSQSVQSLESQGIQVIPRLQTGRAIVDELSNQTRGDIQVLLAPRRPSGRAVLHTSYLNAQSEVQIDQGNTPQLQDHKVQGLPAVPGVMVMEWFMRNARQLAHRKGYLRCRDFQQLQGIALPDFGNSATPFSIVMDSLSSFQWGGQSSVRLVDADGQLRYAALVEKIEDVESLGLTAAPELDLERTAWTGSHVYGPGALFHGPSFQVIHRVEGVSPQGALGRLLPPEDAGWPEDTYLFHPAMIDGITQLAFVWGLFTQDSEFFVTSIGDFVQAPQPNYNQALRCVLEGLDSSPEYLRLNAYLESDAGETIAIMRNIECHPLPGRSQS